MRMGQAAMLVVYGLALGTAQPVPSFAGADTEALPESFGSSESARSASDGKTALTSGGRSPNTSEGNFEHLWQTFDQAYPLFGHRRVDWSAIYNVYRPRVTNKTSDRELFEIMSQMLSHLNDNHVQLTSPFGRSRAGILSNLKMEDFSLDLIETRYLKDSFDRYVRNVMHSGLVAPSVGYLHIRAFGLEQESADAIDTIIGKLKDTKGLIVDIRGNTGGSDEVATIIANRFADRPRMFGIRERKNGPAHDDFASPIYMHVQPEGDVQYTKPVLVLMNRHTRSAGENFALAMRTLPHVTLLGQFTSGAFASVYPDTLPNGWKFLAPWQRLSDQLGRCWEGIGVPPDLRSINTTENIFAERDQVLEFAVDLIQSGGLRPRDGELDSVAPREGLGGALAKALAQGGDFDVHFRSFLEKRKGPRSEFFIDEWVLNDISGKLLEKGRVDDAIKVLRVAVEEFPASWNLWDSLAIVYRHKGDLASADKCIERSRKENPRVFPWERETYDDQTEALGQQ